MPLLHPGKLDEGAERARLAHAAERAEVRVLRHAAVPRQQATQVLLWAALQHQLLRSRREARGRRSTRARHARTRGAKECAAWREGRRRAHQPSAPNFAKNVHKRDRANARQMRVRVRVSVRVLGVRVCVRVLVCRPE